MAMGAAGLEFCAGDFYPLGATRIGKNVNFAVSVPGAEKCTLKLCFDGKTAEIEMDETKRFGAVFAVKVKNLTQEFTYSFLALGKEFTDPYAKSVRGREIFGKPSQETVGTLIADNFDWKGDKNPGRAFEKLIIYKIHPRGFTADESSNVRHRGTFLGIIEKMPYIKKLGVNAVLLMPCVEFDECMSDETLNVPVYTNDLKNKGSFHREKSDEMPVRVNFWGYGAKAEYFAVKSAYAADTEHPEREFKTLVRAFHKAGIEVLMEFSFPDNVSAGFVSDVLRFWVSEYHIDGFRFINMPVPDFCISKDPYLANTKLIASGWDETKAYAGEELPRRKHLAVMDETFEYTVRRFLKGDEGMVNAFSECHRRNNRKSCCVNMITDSNGFTLNDLYAYDVKHNEANGENNRDGREINYSWNCGREGENPGRKIALLRRVMIKNALIALFTAQGVPMLLAGDEFLNSQHGNNNAYCKDDPLGWLNWNSRGIARETTLFVMELIALRKEHKVFRNAEILRLMDYVSYGCPDLSYHGMKAWGPDFSYHSRCLGMLFNGGYAPARNGTPDASFYVLFNMDYLDHDFDLPLVNKAGKWEVVLSANSAKALAPGDICDRTIALPARCAIVLKETE